MKTVKLSLSILIVILGVNSIHAQSSWGLRGGLNYNSNGEFLSEASEVYKNPKSNAGYHVGLFKKIDLLGFFLRPELVYTSTTSSYNGDDLSMSKIDLPLNLGSGFIGPTYIFAGPSLQYVLSSEFAGVDTASSLKDITIGANIGLGISLNKINIDLRYERGLTEKEMSFLTQKVYKEARIDTRQDQLILSLLLELK
ncbi:MAG: outer membrane beta-barrel protein [Flavobacteriaceae bacterium]